MLHMMSNLLTHIHARAHTHTHIHACHRCTYVCTVESSLSDPFWSKKTMFKYGISLNETTIRCTSCIFVYALITLFNAATVRYNTLQQWAKYVSPANPLFIDHQNNTPKTFAFLEELTFCTIAEINFYVKQHSLWYVSRMRPLVDPMYKWGV